MVLDSRSINSLEAWQVDSIHKLIDRQAFKWFRYPFAMGLNAAKSQTGLDVFIRTTCPDVYNIWVDCCARWQNDFLLSKLCFLYLLAGRNDVTADGEGLLNILDYVKGYREIDLTYMLNYIKAALKED